MTKKTKKEDDSKLFAFLAVLLSVIGFIIALLAKRDNKYVMFYAKQSLVLFLAWIVVQGLTEVLDVLTFVGSIINPILWVSYILLWVIAMINSLSGQQRETPFIGEFARKIDL